jgi:hypothetical protein
MLRTNGATRDVMSDRQLIYGESVDVYAEIAASDVM